MTLAILSELAIIIIVLILIIRY